MRISQRLNLGFLAITMWTAVIGHISLFQLNKISDPLSSDIPTSIDSISETAYWDGLAQAIRYNDELATQSARNYAFTQDKKWEQRYKNAISVIDSIMKEAVDKRANGNEAFLSQVSKTRFILAEMENKSFELIHNGKAQKAVDILESTRYQNQKRIHEKYLEDHVNRIRAEHGNAIRNSERTVNSTLKRTQDLTKSSRRLVSIFTIGALVLALSSGFLIARSIYQPLQKLRTAATEIGKGNLDTDIDIKSNDEIGRVAASFKKMTDDLKKTTTSIDNLSQEIIDRKKAEEYAKITCEKLEKTNRELKQIQSQQVQNAKLISIGQLAAGVAHELNTPIGYVSSNFDTLRDYVTKMQKLLQMYEELICNNETLEQSKLSDKAGQIRSKRDSMQINYILDDITCLFNDTREGIERVTTIVKTLRDFSRIDQLGSHDEYNINEGIKTTLIVASNEIKYCADVETELSEVPPIICDTGQINQVLLNIIVNASQAIESQESSGKGKIEIKTYATDDDVVCEISDNGPGIEAGNLSQIFDPFFTTKPIGKGTGLGLSISYDIIVLKHNGELLVDSAVGKGTKFTIKLPRSRKKINKKLEIENHGKQNRVICG